MAETLTIKKETLWKYSTFVLAVLLVVMSFLYFSKEPTGNVVDVPGQQVPSAGGAVKVSIDNDAVLGDKDAPVTIVEFSDYQCPYCGRFYSQAYQDIKKEYVDTGKVKIVFRDFPLSFHPMAQPAAEAAECAKEKGGDKAYYQMHDKIFASQDSLSIDNLKAWAKELGYDISSCLDTGKYKSEVQKDAQDGQSYGVTGTPAFFVNGKMIVGAQPYTNFKQAIDAALAEA